MDYQIKFTDTTKPGFVVKPYTANGPKGPGSPTPLYSTAVGANTSLVILGKGAFDYGEPIQQNFVHLLENFAFETRPAYPIQGQLWFKTIDGADINQTSDPTRRGLYAYNGATWSQLFMAGVPASGDMDMGGYKITGLGDATEDSDALNRKTASQLYVDIAGDQMTGPLNMSSNRITNVANAVDTGDVISMGYGDSRYIMVSGGAGATMMGDLNMNNHKITNVTDATNPQDALNLRTAQSIFITAGTGGSVDGGTY